MAEREIVRLSVLIDFYNPKNSGVFEKQFQVISETSKVIVFTNDDFEEEIYKEIDEDRPYMNSPIYPKCNYSHASAVIYTKEDQVEEKKKELILFVKNLIKKNIVHYQTMFEIAEKLN